MLEEAIQVKSQLQDAIMSGKSLSNVKDSLVGENNYLGGAEILSAASVLGVFGTMLRDELFIALTDRNRFCHLLRNRLKGAEALVLLGNHITSPSVELGGVREGEIIPDEMAERHCVNYYVGFYIPSIAYGHMDSNRMGMTRSITTELIFSHLRKVDGVFSESGYELKATQDALRQLVWAETSSVLDEVVNAFCSEYRRSLEQVGIYGSY